MKLGRAKSASAGTRTRDSSLEGLHANPYTTDACVDTRNEFQNYSIFCGQPWGKELRKIVGTVSREIAPAMASTMPFQESPTGANTEFVRRGLSAQCGYRPPRKALRPGRANGQDPA